MMKTKNTQGFYCLANDAVLEWTIAFLESFRIHEPDGHLIIIPFDDNTERLEKLTHQYKFEFFQDKSLLSELDLIGSHFSDEYAQIHTFRKFAAFWGRFDRFLFIDSDIVLLDRTEELFAAYLSSNCEFMYSDPNMEEVYEPGIFREEMIANYSAVGFNAGFFISSKNTISLEDLEALAETAQLVKDNFVTRNGEQPFLNYCVHTKKLKAKAFADVIDDLSEWTWAGLHPVSVSNGIYRLNDKKLPYLHWAALRCNAGMPHRSIFLRYRLNSLSLLSRLGYIVTSLYSWWTFRLLRKTFKTLNIQNDWVTATGRACQPD
jgi:hypothetical protein